MNHWGEEASIVLREKSIGCRALGRVWRRLLRCRWKRRNWAESHVVAEEGACRVRTEPPFESKTKGAYRGRDEGDGGTC